MSCGCALLPTLEDALTIDGVLAGCPGQRAEMLRARSLRANVLITADCP